MNTARKAPVAKRIFVTGTKADGNGYTVLVRDHFTQQTTCTIPAPSYRAGTAIVRALRELDAKHGTIF